MIFPHIILHNGMSANKSTKVVNYGNKIEAASVPTNSSNVENNSDLMQMDDYAFFRFIVIILGVLMGIFLWHIFKYLMFVFGFLFFIKKIFCFY